MNQRRAMLAIIATLALAGCAGTASPSGRPSSPPSASPSATPAASPKAVVELRYALLDRFGALWYCDPDEYPIGRDELTSMRERWPELAADPALPAIAARLGLDPAALTDDQRLTLYREWKMLNAVFLDPLGDRARFDLRFRPAPGAADGLHVAGTIRFDGSIDVEQQEPSGEPICPICLARGTRIATPDGGVPVEELAVGMRVWTLDRAGRRVAAGVVRVGSARVPATHQVVRLVLDDGRTLVASPGHPLGDGRLLGAVRAGDVVDGGRVVSAEREPYELPATFDLLPAGDTGFYWAGDILLASTLNR